MRKVSTQSREMVYLIFTIFGLSWFVMKISLPTLPLVQAAMHASEWAIKTSIVCFFLSFSVSQIPWAILSKKFSLSGILCVALSLLLVGTGCIIQSTHIGTFILGRILEGFGAGAISPIGRAVIGNIYSREQIARIFPAIPMLTGWMPAFAPILASLILTAFGWRAVFVTFFALCFVYLVWYLCRFPTVTICEREDQVMKSFLHDCMRVLPSPRFWAYVICYATTYAVMLSYYNAMPFWYGEQMHMKADHYTWFGLYNVLAYMSALMFMRFVGKNLDPHKLLRIVMLVAVIVSLLTTALSFFDTHTHLYEIMVPMAVIAFCAGVTSPTSNTLILNTFKKYAAVASAISSLTVFFAVAIVTHVAVYMHIQNIALIGGMMLVTTLLGLLLYVCLIRGRGQAVLD